MPRSTFVSVLTIGCAILLCSAPLFSQLAPSTITGSVTDPSGKVVPGVTITVTNVATGVVNTAKTDAGGDYTVPYLPNGTYKVSAEAAGFGTSVNPHVLLNAQTTEKVDFTLAVGAVQQVVSVTSAAPLLQTADNTLQSNFTTTSLAQLPTGMNVNILLTITPGITQENNSFGAAVQNQSGGVAAATNGLRDTMGAYTYDGSWGGNSIYNYEMIIPILDSIEEVNVQTGNYSAEYGILAGAHVNFALKSGTNSYHGTAFEFFGNNVLNARNFFSPTVPPSRYNEFGGTVGGPIKKNKLFFFGSYEGLRSRSYTYLQDTVLTPAQRNGDLSVNVLGQPVPAFKDPTTGAPFPNNQIPTSRIVPTAVAALTLLAPLPNSSGGENWQGNIAFPTTRNYYMGKIDYVISDADHLSGHVYISRYNSLTASIDAAPFTTQTTQFPAYNAAPTWTHIFNPNTILASTVSWNREPDTGIWWENPSSFNTRSLFSMNIPSSITPTDVMNTYPQFTISGFTAVGENGNIPLYQFDENYGVSQQLTLIRGKHNLTIGYDFRRFRAGRFVNQDVNGLLSYSNTNPTGTGYALADFLLGLPATSTISTSPLTADLRHTIFDPFIEDNWKVTRKLAVSLGLRYEMDSPPNEHWGRMTNFGFTSPGQFNPVGAGLPLYSTPNTNFAPRVGITYQLTSKDVIRTGFGTFYSFPSLLYLILKAANPPYSSTYNFSSAPGAPLTDANAFPIGSAATGGVVAPKAWASYEPMPRVYQWNFDLQHSFTPSTMLDIGYVGNRADHLVVSRTLNVPSSPGTLCPISGPIPGCIPLGTLQSQRPLPNFGSVAYWDPMAFSTYEALQVAFTKRLSGGLWLHATYTWSKSLDLASNENTTVTYWPDNSKGYYGPSDQDQPQRFNLGYVYYLPVGTGRHWAPSNRIANEIIGGWQVSGITTYGSGSPFSVGYSTSLNNIGVTQLPNRVCNGTLANGSIQEWFNTSCFVSPIPANLQSTYNYGFQGNSGHGILSGPHSGVWNLGLMKNFTTFGEQYLQFRAELMNAFNLVNFGLPATTVGPGITNAGVITTAGSPRNIEFELKYVF